VVEEKVKSVFTSLFEKVLNEQKCLDSAVGKSVFEKYGSYEELYRYWLVAPLFSAGYGNIEYEKIYPGQEPGRGRKASCDIVADDRLWIELKFCYSDTVYTDKELLKDPERLNSLKDEGITRVYCMVCITENEQMGSKLSQANSKITKIVGKEPEVFSKKIGISDANGQNEHFQLFVWTW